MKTITSRQSLEIKEVIKLHQTKYRKERKQFIAQGMRTCSTLFESGMKPIVVYVTDDMLDDIQKLVNKATITLVSPHVMAALATVDTPSGILSVFAIPPTPTPDRLTPGLVLTRLADPGNVGTLIRSCVAMNIQSIVIIEGVDPWHPKVIQASTGTIGYITVFQWSWNQLIQHKKNLTLYALVVAGGKKPDIVDRSQALLVIGSEAHGIPQEWAAQCDEYITLPMPGKTESLNAAVAGSIALYLVYN